MNKMTKRKTSNGKAYSKPVLTQYDDLRTITLGSSPIGEESGPGGVDFRVVGGAPPQTSGQGETSDIFN